MTAALGLRAYQHDVFWDHSSGIVVLHWSRQIGKSFVLAAWAVWRLLSRPGRLVTVLSNSKENGAEFLMKCAEVCRLHNTRFETVVKTPGLDFEDMRMELRIRAYGKVGRIKVLAANPRTARGFSGDLILDEFAFHEDGNKIWEAAEPILASNKDFLCRIASTGNGKRNLFYRIVGEGLGEGPRSNVQGPKLGNIEHPTSNTEHRMEDGESRTRMNGELELGIPVGENPTWTRSADSWAVAGMIVDGVAYVPGHSNAECGTRSAELGKEAKECPRSMVEPVRSADCGVRNEDANIEHPTPNTEHRTGEGKRLLSPALSSLECEARGKNLDGQAGAETSGSAGLFRVAAHGDVRCPEDPNIEHPTPNTEHRMEDGESRTSTTTRTDAEHPKGWTPNGECPPSHGGCVDGKGPYFVSKAGFKVSRVTRTMAHSMGLEIYDSQTREAITPEQARAQALDKAAYDQNYECSFADESLALLSHELISAAECDDEDVALICEQDWTPDALELMRQAKSPLYAGLDVGRKVDLSVLTVLERVDKVFYVRGMLRMRNMRLPEQELRLKELCQCRQVRQVCIDMTGLGLGLFEYAQRTMGEHRISGINFSSSVSATKVIREEGRNREKVRVTEAMAMEVLRVYEDRRMRQPRDWQLREDLRRPGKVTTPAGRVSIAATRDGSGHADHFWSVALALEAAGGSVSAPFYWQAIPRRNRGLLI